MKTQLDNLIRFVLNNHINMDQDFMNNDPTYIMEKWDKYIGFKPIDKNLISYKTLSNINIEDIYSLELSEMEYGKEDIKLKKWLVKWNVKEETYNEIKEIINFIILINRKKFRVNNRWLTSDLIILFEENIGSFEDINKNNGGTLHTIIENFMIDWLNDTQVKRDYNLSLLV